MKVAFVTTYDATDINNWSGTPYYMSRALIKAGAEVEYIGNLNCQPKFFPRLKAFLFNRILNGKLGEFVAYYTAANLKCIAAQLKMRLNSSDADIILSPGAIPIAYLNTDKPIVMWSDATFALMHKYSEYSNLSKSSASSCHKYERNVIRRLSYAVFSSEWAAKSAIENYGAKETNVAVIPYGANIVCNRSIKDIIEFNKAKSKKVCKLLFVGKDWERKGGDAAVNIARVLNYLNIETKLTVVGCKPVLDTPLYDFVDIIGFVDKSTKEGNDLMDKFYREHHFFVLPTRADCTPIVFSEANSFGLPVITTNTGGIPSLIRDDVNGKKFEFELDVDGCARYIKDIFTDYEKYVEFSYKSFEEYNSSLNWDVSISKLLSYMKVILSR